MEIASFNTVESQLILHREEKMQEFHQAALDALDRVKDKLDSTTVRSVVTHYEKRRNFFGLSYYKTHTMEYATWRIPTSDILFLCSDGKVYGEEPVRGFWGFNVTRLMPVDRITPGVYRGHQIDHDHFIDLVKKVGKPGGITGFNHF